MDIDLFGVVSYCYAEVRGGAQRGRKVWQGVGVFGDEGMF